MKPVRARAMAPTGGCRVGMKDIREGIGVPRRAWKIA